MVRNFARWMQSVDDRTEVPPAELLPSKIRRPRPYIYTETEIHSILREAKRIPSWYGLQTHAILFGLLAVSGMRVSEAIHLRDSDVDPEAKILTIQHAKGGKNRCIALSASTAKVLATYRAERQYFLGKNALAFFIQESGRP
ncbi:hypothetical protein GCM10007047_25570 [Cerasicoccus arenae]|uniref:Tyr recombinase domain-containing protein n=2 Tax=Cerasicoccus arenae TaxID=424488 RepID=A0A8J3DHC0_9BACT|nr:hypothetical protein GCM10007047_25570 [Cerasicoccus arenae]